MRKIFGLGVTLLVASATVISPLSAAGSSVGPTAVTPASSALTYSLDRTIRDDRIIESSGLARSTRDRDVLFTHNDSGDSARVFAVGRFGYTRAVLNLAGASAHDWEDISSGPGNSLWVGDIGDNNRMRTSIAVYKFVEPAKLANGTVANTRYNFTYPDGPHDAEALMVHPSTGRVYIVTKSSSGGAIYRAPSVLSATNRAVLTKVAAAPASVTAASFAPDATSFVLANYTTVFFYSSIGGPAQTLAKPSTRQGESAEIDRTASKLLIGSEGSSSPIYAMLPSQLAESVTKKPAPTSWKVGIVEDFNTISSLRWNVRNNTYNNNEDSYLLAANTTIENGVLRIQGKKESVGGRDYTSGYIDTNGKYALPDYFRLKVRAKVPMEQGMWAAPVWFRPSDFSGGEIDLIETYGDEAAEPIIHQTIHTAYGTNRQTSHKRTSYSVVGGDPTAWHSYVIEKTSGKIVMWVDGVQTAAWTSADPTWFNEYYEVGNRWNLRVNLQIGGAHGLPDSTTDWSPDLTAMQIDYIKTWVPNN